MASTRAPWWMYVFAASFLGYFCLQVYTASPFYDGPGPFGFNFDSRSSTLVVLSVVPNSVGERAGLRAGDHIVAVNGVAVRRRVEWDMASMNFEAGRPMPLEIERGGQRVELIVALERRSESTPWEFWLLAGGNFVTLGLGLVVAFRRPNDFIARMGGWFLATIAITIFPPFYGFNSVWRHLPVPLGALLWIAHISTGILPAIVVTFFGFFPRPLFRRRWIWSLVWAPVLLLFAWQLPLEFATVYQWKWTPRSFEVSVASWWTISGCYLFAGLTLLVVNYRRLKDVNEQRRIRVMAFGTVVGWVAFGIFLTLIIMGGGRLVAALFSTPIPTALFVIYLAFPLSFAYAILRHRVFDLGVLLRRGLQYALARRLLVSAVPVFAVILLLDLLLHGDQPILAVFRARGWVYAALAVGAAIAHKRRQGWLEALDRRFFRERYDAHRLLRDVVEEVRQARSFERDAPHVVTRIEAALHPEFVALLAREPREPSYRSLCVAPAGRALPALPAESKLMSLVRLLGKPLEVPQTGSSWLGEQLPHQETEFLRQSRIELLVPISAAADRTEALLALGVKRSEEPYAREDLDLLVAIASSLALLLEKPTGTSVARSDVFEECSQCGVCYDSGVTKCAQEGARLVPVILPRHLDGRYRLEKRLGRGGMGTVYAASDTALERRVAVKVIREDLVGSTEAAERFRGEARVAASFAHPNVVTIHDFGVAAGTRAFLVMELLEGETLREGLKRQKGFPPARALSLLRDVCAALEAAHRRQLVHRDLKPENIFLVRGESGETAKILDFGIAKFLSTATQQATADTAPGALLGTPRYMGPEQWRGQEPHPMWDLWALTVMIYEILTGAYPFEGSSPADWFGAGPSARFTPVPSILPEASSSWQEFFEHAFAHESSRRPQSADKLFSDFQSKFI